VYGQLYHLLSKGIARIAGELPERPETPSLTVEDFPDSVQELIWSAERNLSDDPDSALSMIQKALEIEPKDLEAQRLLTEAEERLIKHIYTNSFSPTSVPVLLISASDLTNEHLDPQEGFILSRINGEWDIQSILSICPFREADCLRMIKRLIDRGVIGI
jgi:hypothetical protein